MYFCDIVLVETMQNSDLFVYNYKIISCKRTIATTLRHLLCEGGLLIMLVSFFSSSRNLCTNHAIFEPPRWFRGSVFASSSGGHRFDAGWVKPKTLELKLRSQLKSILVGSEPE